MPTEPTKHARYLLSLEENADKRKLLQDLISHFKIEKRDGSGGLKWKTKKGRKRVKSLYISNAHLVTRQSLNAKVKLKENLEWLVRRGLIQFTWEWDRVRVFLVLAVIPQEYLSLEN